MTTFNNRISADSIDTPKWLQELKKQCELTNQRRVAEMLGYSQTVINQVLKGIYRGDLSKVEAKIRGAFLGETVGCPILGELEINKCINYQSSQSTANCLRVSMRKTCPTCLYNRANLNSDNTIATDKEVCA